MRRVALILFLFASPALAQQPSQPTLPQQVSAGLSQVVTVMTNWQSVILTLDQQRAELVAANGVLARERDELKAQLDALKAGPAKAKE